MKTKNFKAILILIGSLLVGTGNISAANKLAHFMSNELSNFHLTGLYLIVGIIAAGLAFYFISNKFNKEEEKQVHRASSPTQRRHHHRPVVKKTA